GGYSLSDQRWQHQSQAQEGQQPGKDQGQECQESLRPLQGTWTQKGCQRRSQPTQRAVDDQDPGSAKEAQGAAGYWSDRPACLPTALPQIQGWRVQEHSAYEFLYKGQGPCSG